MTPSYWLENLEEVLMSPAIKMQEQVCRGCPVRDLDMLI